MARELDYAVEPIGKAIRAAVASARPQDMVIIA